MENTERIGSCKHIFDIIYPSEPQLLLQKSLALDERGQQEKVVRFRAFHDKINASRSLTGRYFFNRNFVLFGERINVEQNNSLHISRLHFQLRKFSTER